MNKREAYRQLVCQRKACHRCESFGVVNPSTCVGGKYDTDHIGPWTGWQGNLDADLMVVAQDWGGVEYFVKHKGIEDDTNPTNVNLVSLLQSIGIHIDLPNRPNGASKLFFTNATLCLKPGKLTGPVPAQCFSRCGTAFLRPQIDLVKPKVVVTLGYKAYEAVLLAYGRLPERRMKDAVEKQTFEIVGTDSIVVPVYHCGAFGRLSRSFEQQKADWSRVKVALVTVGSPSAVAKL